ncbi:MAG: IS630 family transposase [Bacteroidota bacterium]|nr:IS630 family transposase [Bacteroidota bacterium]
MYFQDESRFGLLTKNGRALTARGVKPICTFQQVFQSLYLFGAFSPITGDHLLLEMPFCNSDTFQLFLDEFSAHNPNELKLMVLDNGAFHKAKALQIPKNIILIFLPPYSPELNPAEKIWAKFKRQFANRIFKSLDDLEIFICDLAKSLVAPDVKSICSFDYIFLDSYWTNV